MRFGQRYQASLQEMQNSLFGALGGVEVATPAIPNAEPWSQLERLNRERDLVGGLVVDFQTRFGKKGNQFGIMKIEDYSGSFEFMLFGNKFVEYKNFGTLGLAIVVRGAFEKGYGDVVRFNVHSVDLLDNLKGKMVKNLVITLSDEDLNNVDFLRQHLGAEGDNCCELFFRLRDHANGKYVMLRSNRLIAVDKRLMDALHEAGIECQVNARV